MKREVPSHMYLNYHMRLLLLFLNWPGNLTDFFGTWEEIVDILAALVAVDVAAFGGSSKFVEVMLVLSLAEFAGA